MARRLDLHAILKSIPGVKQVYFQPPPTMVMVYPCIVYRRDYALTTFADNRPYLYRKRYLVTVIDQDPDSDIPLKVAELPSAVFDRHYTQNQLNHDVYKLYF